MPRCAANIRLPFLFQGKIASQGTPSDLMKSGIDLVTHDENESDAENPRKGSAFGRRPSENRARKSSFCSNSSSNGHDESISGEYDEVKQLEEASSGKVSGSITMHYFKSGAHWSMLLLLFLSLLFTQILISASDIWISIWYVCILHAIVEKSWRDSHLQTHDSQGKIRGRTHIAT